VIDVLRSDHMGINARPPFNYMQFRSFGTSFRMKGRQQKSRIQKTTLTMLVSFVCVCLKQQRLVWIHLVL
jgi:hypothetical protein